MVSFWRKFKNSIFLNLAVWGCWGLLWLLYLSCRKSFSQASLPKQPCVVVFWHGRLSMMSFAYLHWWGKKRRGKVIISDHKDGEFIAKIIKFFGIFTIRGSSSKGGARALIYAIKEIKSGTDVIITPDGPRGPRHSIADGAVAIAQMQKCQICTLNYEASAFWEFKSWDKMILPKPFSKINFSLSDPFSVDGLDAQAAKELIQEKLWQVSQNDGGKTVAEHKEDFVLNLKTKKG